MFFWSVVSLDRAEQVFSPTSICEFDSRLPDLEYSTVSRCFPSVSKNLALQEVTHQQFQQLAQQ